MPTNICNLSKKESKLRQKIQTQRKIKEQERQEKFQEMLPLFLSFQPNLPAKNLKHYNMRANHAQKIGILNKRTSALVINPQIRNAIKRTMKHKQTIKQSSNSNCFPTFGRRKAYDNYYSALVHPKVSAAQTNLNYRARKKLENYAKTIKHLERPTLYEQGKNVGSCLVHTFSPGCFPNL